MTENEDTFRSILLGPLDLYSRRSSPLFTLVARSDTLPTCNNLRPPDIQTKMPRISILRPALTLSLVLGAGYFFARVFRARRTAARLLERNTDGRRRARLNSPRELYDAMMEAPLTARMRAVQDHHIRHIMRERYAVFDRNYLDESLQELFNQYGLDERLEDLTPPRTHTEFIGPIS